MADLVISGTLTPATGETKYSIHRTGAAVSAKVWVYLDSSDGYRAKTADAGDEDQAKVKGIVLSAVADDQDAIVYGDGAIINSSSADFVAGQTYALGNATDGAMTATPLTDNTAGDYITNVCVALSTTQFQVKIKATGATV